MVQSIKVDDFLKKAEKEKNGKTTIFQVIAGDHFIRYDLKTKQGKIDVEVSSFKWSAVAQNQNQSGRMHFTQQEMDAIIQVLKIGKSPEETAKIERMLQLIKMLR